MISDAIDFVLTFQEIDEICKDLDLSLLQAMEEVCSIKRNNNIG